MRSGNFEESIKEVSEKAESQNVGLQLEEDKKDQAIGGIVLATSSAFLIFLGSGKLIYDLFLAKSSSLKEGVQTIKGVDKFSQETRIEIENFIVNSDKKLSLESIDRIFEEVYRKREALKADEGPTKKVRKIAASDMKKRIVSSDLKLQFLEKFNLEIPDTIKTYSEWIEFIEGQNQVDFKEPKEFVLETFNNSPVSEELRIELSKEFNQQGMTSVNLEGKTPVDIISMHIEQRAIQQGSIEADLDLDRLALLDLHAEYDPPKTRLGRLLLEYQRINLGAEGNPKEASAAAKLKNLEFMIVQESGHQVHTFNEKYKAYVAASEPDKSKILQEMDKLNSLWFEDTRLFFMTSIQGNSNVADALKLDENNRLDFKTDRKPQVLFKDVMQNYQRSLGNNVPPTKKERAEIDKSIKKKYSKTPSQIGGLPEGGNTMNRLKPSSVLVTAGIFASAIGVAIGVDMTQGVFLSGNLKDKNPWENILNSHLLEAILNEKAKKSQLESSMGTVLVDFVHSNQVQ